MNQNKTSINAKAAAKIFNATLLFIKGNVPIQICPVTNEGDVIFSVNINDLGINIKLLQENLFLRQHAWVNFFGELLVRQHMESDFAKLLFDKKYAEYVKSFNHRDFGMKLEADKKTLLFQFHISLINKLINETLAHELATEIAQLPEDHSIMRNPGKPAAFEEKFHDSGVYVTSYQNNGAIKIQVTKGDDPRHAVACMIRALLGHLNIANKDIHVNDNMFSYELECEDMSSSKY